MQRPTNCLYYHIIIPLEIVSNILDEGIWFSCVHRWPCGCPKRQRAERGLSPFKTLRYSGLLLYPGVLLPYGTCETVISAYLCHSIVIRSPGSVLPCLLCRSLHDLRHWHLQWYSHRVSCHIEMKHVMLPYRQKYVKRVHDTEKKKYETSENIWTSPRIWIKECKQEHCLTKCSRTPLNGMLQYVQPLLCLQLLQATVNPRATSHFCNQVAKMG